METHLNSASLAGPDTEKWELSVSSSPLRKQRLLGCLINHSSQDMLSAMPSHLILRLGKPTENRSHPQLEIHLTTVLGKCQSVVLTIALSRSEETYSSLHLREDILIILPLYLRASIDVLERATTNGAVTDRTAHIAAPTSAQEVSLKLRNLAPTCRNPHQRWIFGMLRQSFFNTTKRPQQNTPHESLLPIIAVRTGLEME